MNEVGDLATKGIEEAEVLAVFFTLVFTAKTGLQESQKVWNKED